MQTKNHHVLFGEGHWVEFLSFIHIWPTKECSLILSSATECSTYYLPRYLFIFPHMSDCLLCMSQVVLSVNK